MLWRTRCDIHSHSRSRSYSAVEATLCLHSQQIKTASKQGIKASGGNNKISKQPAHQPVAPLALPFRLPLSPSFLSPFNSPLAGSLVVEFTICAHHHHSPAVYLAGQGCHQIAVTFMMSIHSFPSSTNALLSRQASGRAGGCRLVE